MSTIRGRLEAVPVPWTISPSDPWLRLNVAEEREAELTVLARFPEDDTHRPVVLSFATTGFVLFAPAENGEALPEAAYDWSGVPGRLMPGEGPKAWFARRRAHFQATGHCPFPGMYRVHDSAWIEALGVGRWGLTHFAVAGHDRRVDVLAEGFTWEAGEPVEYR